MKEFVSLGCWLVFCVSLTFYGFVIPPSVRLALSTQKVLKLKSLNFRSFRTKSKVFYVISTLHHVRGGIFREVRRKLHFSRRFTFKRRPQNVTRTFIRNNRQSGPASRHFCHFLSNVRQWFAALSNMKQEPIYSIALYHSVSHYYECYALFMVIV